MTDHSNPSKTENMYELLFNNLLDGLAYCQMIFDKQEQPIDFVYVRVNKNFEALTGLKNVEGKKVTEAIPGIAISNPEVFEIYGRVSKTGMPERFETYVAPLSRWFLISVYSPKQNFFVAVFQNITERKRIENDLENARIATRNVLENLRTEKEALALAKAKDEALLESIGEGLVAVDTQKKIIVVNKAALVILGWKMEDLIGKVITTLPLADDAGNSIPLSKRPTTIALTTGEITKDTYVFMRPDGTKLPIAITATPIKLGGQTIGLIEIIRDISREKEIEKLRVDFLALASHQLRTPLSGTKWLIETMQRGVTGKLNDKQKGYLESIYQVNERMIRLVTDMLDVLILESGGTAVKLESVSITKIFDEVSLMMKPASDNKGILLRSSLTSKPGLTITSNSQMVRSILECFVSNALNYSQRGQEVSLAVTEEPAVVEFSVTDSGIGIPEEEQRRIFERFYRASNAKGLKPDGTGLGLYIASLLAKKIGGAIVFQSEPNRETVFRLRVPKKVGQIAVQN